jgi:excinuclease ABC subunit C
LPSSPGVYWFLDANGKVIYVGKAKNLANRLKSYSLLNHLLPKTKQLVAHAQAVKYHILKSEFEALLVEATLIQAYQPHYNILLKDDKSPLYIVITNETYPRVLAIRKNDRQKYRIVREFGPFPSSTKVKEVLKITRRIFPFCTATPNEKKHHHACFYVHLNLCPGACTAAISPEKYQLIIDDIGKFLTGKHQEIVNDYRQKIQTAIEEEAFEVAQQYKTRIEAITYIHSHYQYQKQDSQLPNLTNDVATQKILQLKKILKDHGLSIAKIDRIEGYDVANIQGVDAAVSMVVSTHGQPDHDSYRHFSIKTLKTPNDVGMLKEAITRRFHHPEWGIPDLIMIDGGKPQLKAVLSIMTTSIPVVSLAKHPDRLLIATNKSPVTITTYKLDPTNPGSQLLIALRDEAHRFSRRLHHHRHHQRLFETSTI